jgi:hypothetical protein
MKMHQAVYCLLIISLLFGQSGCSDVGRSGLTKQFVDQDIKPEQLVGYWVITEESIQKLINIAKIVKYTNQTDNIIYLKEDGSCIYRAFSDYSGPKITDENYDSYVVGISHSESWYVWDPFGDIMMLGPYRSKETINSGKYALTIWSIWKLEDYHKMKIHFTGQGQRYQVGFGVSEDSLPSISWEIGSITNELVLWQPMWPPGSTRNFVIFRKKTLNELKSIISKELGKPTAALPNE